MEPEAVVQLPIKPQASDRSENNLRDLVETAFADAMLAAQAEFAVDAKVEVAGAFGGFGEAALVLTIWHIASGGAVAFGKGAAAAARTAFVNKYLVPKLRSLNILPGEPTDISPSSTKQSSSA